MCAQSSEFYTRESTIPGLGSAGITKLRSSTVAVVGVGGVGSSAAYYLARSGIGTIRLIDQDIVEPANLQRIQSSTNEDLYQPKAEVMSRLLSKFDKATKLEPVVDTLTSQNALQLLEGVDLVFDGLDNFRTRYLLNRISIAKRIPYLFASAVAEQAHLALYNPPETACLECVMPGVTDRFNESCEVLGVGPSITGITGAIGADASIRYLTGQSTRLVSELMTVDLAGTNFLFTQLQKNPNCACQKHQIGDFRESSSIAMLCGEHTANILPKENMEIELSRVSIDLPADKILASSGSVLVFSQGPHTISLFRNGRLLIGGIEDEDIASEIANEVWKVLKQKGF